MTFLFMTIESSKGALSIVCVESISQAEMLAFHFGAARQCEKPKECVSHLFSVLLPAKLCYNLVDNLTVRFSL